MWFVADRYHRLIDDTHAHRHTHTHETKWWSSGVSKTTNSVVEWSIKCQGFSVDTAHTYQAPIIRRCELESRKANQSISTNHRPTDTCVRNEKAHTHEKSTALTMALNGIVFATRARARLEECRCVDDCQSVRCHMFPDSNFASTNESYSSPVRPCRRHESK